MSKKFRNRFLALLCLLTFAAIGLLYYVNWVVQKPFAVILVISDELSVPSLVAARIYGGGADNRLAIERFPNLGLLSTHAADFAVADTAAAATAIATGRKVNNRSLGQDSGGKSLVNLVEIARERGRSVGLVTNTSVTDSGPAAFYACTADPHDTAAIALQLTTGGLGFDLLLGGGAADFIPEHKGGRRKDGRDLTMEMREAGYDVVRDRSQLTSTPLWRAPKLVGLFADGNMAFADEVALAAAQPSLAEMVAQAIQLLQFNRKGYLLIVDAGLPAKSASQNEGERTLREILQVDAAVSTALAFAGENSLVIVTGRTSTGGLRLNGYPFRGDKGVAIVGKNLRGIPSFTWSSGPGSGPADEPTEPSAVRQPAAFGVADDAIVVGVGPGSEELTGFRDNTDIFRVLSKSL
ncbi:MAG: alkaline phosphatase [Terrimicrobiaceae bacterium]